MQPAWLIWARERQAIAHTGLTFAQDPYDRQRYEVIRALPARIVAEHSGAEYSWIEALFAQQAGYATPKVDVRDAAFGDDGGILLVRENADAGRWTLPGGWADVNDTPSECVAREVREEAGVGVAIRKLAADTTGTGMAMCRRTSFRSTSCSLFAISSAQSHAPDPKPARLGFSRSTACRTISLRDGFAAISSSACSCIGGRRTCRPNSINRT